MVSLPGRRSPGNSQSYGKLFSGVLKIKKANASRVSIQVGCARGNLGVRSASQKIAGYGERAAAASCQAPALLRISQSWERAASHGGASGEGPANKRSIFLTRRARVNRGRRAAARIRENAPTDRGERKRRLRGGGLAREDIRSSTLDNPSP